MTSGDRGEHVELLHSLPPKEQLGLGRQPLKGVSRRLGGQGKTFSYQISFCLFLIEIRQTRRA